MSIQIDPDELAGPVPNLRGIYLGDSPHRFVEEDVARLKEEVGVTCIRFGMPPLDLSSEEEEVYREDGFRYVADILDWCAHHDIRCVLDLHNALGRLGGGGPRLRFGRKIALMEFFCRTEGSVLDLPQPGDEWIGLYGVRRPDDSLVLLISNKDPNTDKRIDLTIPGLLDRWSSSLRTLSRGDEDFVYQGHRPLECGSLDLHLPPLSLSQLTVQPSGQRLWTFSTETDTA